MEQNKVKKILNKSLLLATLLISPIVLALPAFPGAEGYGTQTIGGRGGIVCEVTSLKDSGIGSLRKCVEETLGARIVVFKKGGTIFLLKPLKINSSNSNITIAGQTAPGGIQLKNWGIEIENGGHDVVIRHLRIRSGSVACRAKGMLSCDTNNAISMWGGTIPKRVYNIVIDHVSAEWATDQNMSIWDSVSDVTIQHSILAAGATTGHSKGSHSMGFVAGGDIGIDTVNPRSLSIHHSILSHNQSRGPRVDDPTILDFRNNIVYYFQAFPPADFEMGYPVESYPVNFNTSQVNFINNIYLRRSISHSTQILFVDSQTRIYMSGNYTPTYPTGTATDFNANNIIGGVEGVNKLLSPVSTPTVTTDPTSQVLSKVFASVGAKLPYRDSIDSKILSDITNVTGSVGEGQNKWIQLSAGKYPIDSDHDGMADAWEVTHGLNPKLASDRNLDSDSDGYTNVEEYLNELGDK